MLKSLSLLVVFLAVAQKPFPVDQGQQQQTQVQPNTAKPAAPIVITSDIEKENADNAERYAYYKAHKKEYLNAATSQL